jgi:hypothetical protein
VSVRLWQGIAGVATAGWLITVALGVAFWPDASESPAAADGSGSAALDAAPARPGRAPVTRRTFDERPARRRGLRASPRVSDATDPEARNAAHDIPPRAMDAARAQVRDEWQARRAAQAEKRLDRMLDQTATFAETHGLDEDTQVALENAVTDNHIRMQDLFAELRGRSDAAPNDDSRRLERRDAMRQSLTQLEDDVAAVLDDDLADLYLTAIRGEGSRRER